MFNTLSFLSKHLFTTIRPDFMDPSYFIHVSLIIPQCFSSFIDMTIEPKYMVLLHLFCFLLCTTIRLKSSVTNLFQLCAYDILTKIYDPLSFVFFFLGSSTTSSFRFHKTVRPKYMVLYHLFFLFVYDHSTKS